ncbi:hypothetical protein KGY72_04135 [Candidatus Bipolaricaulota bacterium]|nr:hypothetical protein [Candidatus Bipolaricaulota bacterium]MBS3791988.1 hypothetical protein [Candidatus Bipolaricaulota bacterium]
MDFSLGELLFGIGGLLVGIGALIAFLKLAQLSERLLTDKNTEEDDSS